MARELHDREDLLRDARALAPRLTLQYRLADSPITLFAGFRGESLSLYFGDDPVFHFNAAGELRRAHRGGHLIKADRGRLAELRRDATSESVKFAAGEFDEDSQAQFLADVCRGLAELRAALDSGQFTLMGQEPADGDALGRLKRWLATHESISVAASPNVGEGG